MLGAAFRSLHFAVRLRVLLRHLGLIGVALGALMAVPAAVSWAGDPPDIALRYTLVVAAFVGLGAAGARLRGREDLQSNEAMAISALAFALAGLAMAYPLAGYGIAPLDAVFEAVSGITTTGLSTLASVESRPRTFLFARAWLQWVGGLGIVVLALAFMIPSGVSAKRLGFDDREAADTVESTRGRARRILGVYAALTAAGFALLLLTGLSAFDAIAHALAGISTGGFSTRDGSLTAFGPAARSAVSAVSLAGAVSFAWYTHASTRALLDSRLWGLLALTSAGAVALAVASSAPLGAGTTWGQAAWMAISAQSTTGFSTLDAGGLPHAAQALLIWMMVVGGDVGSTAGGLKILRLQLLARVVGARVLRASMPVDSQLPLRVQGVQLDAADVEAAASLLAVYAATVGLSWLAFLACGHDPMDALFDVVSATSTVGLTTGSVGPQLEPWLKGVLCVDMLMGRLELFAFLVLVFPGTWIGRRRASR